MTMSSVQAADIQRVAYSLHTITLTSSSLEHIQHTIDTKIKNNFKAYAHAGIILNVSQVPDINDLDFAAINQILIIADLHLVGISGITTQRDVDYVNNLGLAVVNSNKFAQIREEKLEPKVIVKTIEKLIPVEKEILVEVPTPQEVVKAQPMKVLSRSIRAGEVITALDNSLMIIGAVNPGARIVASHHIIVNGSVKGGEIYAGNPKDQQDLGMSEATISVFGGFRPNVVAIAGTYQTAEDMDQDILLGPSSSNNHGIIVSLQGKALCYSSINSN